MSSIDKNLEERESKEAEIVCVISADFLLESALSSSIDWEIQPRRKDHRYYASLDLEDRSQLVELAPQISEDIWALAQKGPLTIDFGIFPPQNWYNYSVQLPGLIKKLLASNNVDLIVTVYNAGN